MQEVMVIWQREEKILMVSLLLLQAGLPEEYLARLEGWQWELVPLQADWLLPVSILICQNSQNFQWA